MIHVHLMNELMKGTAVSTRPPHVCGLSPLLFHPAHTTHASVDDTTLTGLISDESAGDRIGG